MLRKIRRWLAENYLARKLAAMCNSFYNRVTKIEFTGGRIVAKITTGKAGATVWFQQQRSATHESEVAFLNNQLDRMSAALASSKVAASNKMLKSQIAQKRNLFKTAIDLARGKKAYYSVPRSGRIPKSPEQFMAWVMEAVNEIDPMLAWAHITLENEES